MIGSVCRRLEPEHPIRYGCGLQPGLPGDIRSLSLGGPAVGGSSLRGAFPPFRGTAAQRPGVYKPRSGCALVRKLSPLKTDLVWWGSLGGVGAPEKVGF